LASISVMATEDDHAGLAQPIAQFGELHGAHHPPRTIAAANGKASDKRMQSTVTRRITAISRATSLVWGGQPHGDHQPARTSTVITTRTTKATTITATPSRGSTSCSMRARAEASLSLTG
jgi:hypothetical protein